MRIDLHCDGVETAPGLRDYVAQRMRASIGRFRDHIQWARVKVADVNGAEGGADKRCVVQLRLRNLPDVVFRHHSARRARGGGRGRRPGRPRARPARAPPPARAGDGRDPDMILS